MNDWEDYSTVTIKLTEMEEDEVLVELKQTNIPKNTNMQSLENGWKTMIFKSISQLCGYSILEDNN